MMQVNYGDGDAEEVEVGGITHEQLSNGYENVEKEIPVRKMLSEWLISLFHIPLELQHLHIF